MSERSRGIGLASALAILLLATIGCSGAPISDTGYVGSWKRLSGAPSTISLRKDETGRYVFRWSARDEIKTVTCNTEGVCEDQRRGKKVYEYLFVVTERAGTSGLFVEVTGTSFEAEMQPIHWIDRLVLQPGGAELWSYMLELNGETFDPPRGPVRFGKTSDTPF